MTATRRAEDISKVPISITAINQTDIDTLGIKDFTDMAKYTPGVVIDTDRTQEISIRGIASSGGADTTGIYIDDTPIQTRTDTDALPEAFDVDRIEVLRGPQGTLFGAGAEGGAVRYITTQPSVTQYSIYSRDEVSYTQGGAPNEEVGVAGGGPLIDNALGLRASVLVTHDGGWIDRTDSESPTGNTDPSANILDSDANRYTQELFRLAMLWKPSDSWQITPGIYYQTKSQNDATVYWPVYSDPGQDVYYNGNPERVPTNDEFYLASLKVEGDLGFADFISNTSYFNRHTLSSYGGLTGTTYNLGFYQDLIGYAPNGTSWLPTFPWIDGTGIHLPDGFRYYAPAPLFSYFYNETQELRLQSNDRSSRLQWTVGAFYELDQQTDKNWIYAEYDTALFALYGLTVEDVFGAPLVGNPPASWYTLENQYTRQYAAYADASYAFTRQWKVDVGLRESWIDYSFNEYITGSQEFGPPDISAGDNKEPSFTPKANLSFQADPDDMYYFTYAKGFRPGGANSPIPEAACAQDFHNLGLTSTPISYGSDTTESYEVGAKNNIGNRVQLASAVYWINWANIQQEAVLPICGIGFIGNLGQAVSKGVDFQGTFRLTNSFTVDTAVGFTEARYTAAAKISPLAPTPIVEPGDSINGANGEPVPPWTGTIGFEYRFHAFEHPVFLRADDQYVSSPRWLGPQYDPRTTLYDPANFVLPPQNQVNLRSGVMLGPVEIDAFVNNLTDAHPIITYSFTVPNAVGSSRLETADTLRPRTMGLTFIFRD